MSNDRLRAIRQTMREGRIVSWDDTMWMVEQLEAPALLRVPPSPSPELLAIAALVNGYYNGTRAFAEETLRAIADVLGPPMEPLAASPAGAPPPEEP